MSASASITTQSWILGDVECDPARVRGDGGPINPTLVAPLTVKLNPRPAEEAVAVTELWGRLYLQDTALTPLGEMTRARSPNSPQGLWSSNPNSPSADGAELRIPLTPAHLRVLEDVRPQDGNVPLRVRLDVAAAWVRGEHRLGSAGGAPVLELLPLAWVRTDELRLLVPLVHWVESVLPALGTDRFRTVVISLPMNGPLTPNTPLVRWFDDARARYDAGDWRGCIERCRDVRRAVETTLKATKSDPVSAKAAAASGLPPNPAISSFVDGVWGALSQVTNEAHHPEHHEPVYRAADARAVLLTTATTLEYLAALLNSPTLP